MKTILQLKKLVIIPLLFLVGNVCVGQEKSILYNLSSIINTMLIDWFPVYRI